jgi:hypothetical protein
MLLPGAVTLIKMLVEHPVPTAVAEEEGAAHG